MVSVEERIEFRRYVAEKLEEAFNMYGVGFPHDAVEISLCLKGKVAGTAEMRRDHTGCIEHMGLNFNMEALAHYPKALRGNTVPHEIAHLITYWFYPKARAHGKEWNRICVALGGTGDRTSYMPKVSRVRKTKWYEYHVAGEVVHLSAVRHNKLQNGTGFYSNMPRPGVRNRIKPDMFTGNIIVKD